MSKAVAVLKLLEAVAVPTVVSSFISLFLAVIMAIYFNAVDAFPEAATAAWMAEWLFAVFLISAGAAIVIGFAVRFAEMSRE